MLLTQVTGPASLPVSVIEAKAAVAIDYAEDDAQVLGMIQAAARAVGEMSGRVLTAETWAMSFASGPACDLYLPKSPIQTVDSITYFDADDVQQTADVADFYLVKDDDVAFLRPKSGQAWPVANSQRPDAITVTFTAGYTDVPENLRRAVLMMVAHLYDHRSAVSKGKMAEMPLGLEYLVGLDRLGWVKS